jgi:hypothetical protein
VTDPTPLFDAISQALGQRDWPDLVYVPDDAVMPTVSGRVRGIPPDLAGLLASIRFRDTDLNLKLRTGRAKVRARPISPSRRRKGPEIDLPQQVWTDGSWRTDRRAGMLYVNIGHGLVRYADAIVIEDNESPRLRPSPEPIKQPAPNPASAKQPAASSDSPKRPYATAQMRIDDAVTTHATELAALKNKTERVEFLAGKARCSTRTVWTHYRGD